MKNLISLVALIACNSIFGQVSLDYYLEADHPYDQSIPQPQTLLGYEVGTWHVSHDKLVHYMHRLAESSDRIQIENRGSTYEGRPILLLTITSPENHSRIEEIKSNHIALTESGADQISIEDQPLVVYQRIFNPWKRAKWSQLRLVTCLPSCCEQCSRDTKNPR